MNHCNNDEHSKGSIQGHVSFAEAVANGSRAMVEFLLENGADVDATGRDGTTPLCAAALWGNANMVSYLIERGAKVNAVNDGTGWTALHAACFQEHGKVVRLLLESGSDPHLRDREERTPKDYASISEAIWSFFSARGCERTLKSDLIKKGIIRKVEEIPDMSNALSSFSRPGSAYVRSELNVFQPVHPKGQSHRRQGLPEGLLGGASSKQPMESYPEPIDPLSQESQEISSPTKRRSSLIGLTL